MIDHPNMKAELDEMENRLHALQREKAELAEREEDERRRAEEAEGHVRDQFEDIENLKAEVRALRRICFSYYRQDNVDMPLPCGCDGCESARVWSADVDPNVLEPSS